MFFLARGSLRLLRTLKTAGGWALTPEHTIVMLVCEPLDFMDYVPRFLELLAHQIKLFF
jgi:hypothetical protein